MIDAQEGITEQDEKIIGYAHEMRKAIMIIVNKWDLVEKDDKTLDNFKRDLQGKLKFINYAEYLFISALTGQRTHKVLQMARKCYDNYNKRVSTGILNDVISKAVLTSGIYERYIENQLRDSFDFKGTGIQIEYRQRKE